MDGGGGGRIDVTKKKTKDWRALIRPNSDDDVSEWFAFSFQANKKTGAAAIKLIVLEEHVTHELVRRDE